MKVIFDVKGAKAAERPSEDSILVFDASDKMWYITTKSDLLSEFNKMHEETIHNYDEKLANLEAKWQKFMKDYTEQNSKLIPVLQSILEKEGK